MTLSFYMESISQKDLRDSCNELHKLAETTELAQALISGNIDPLIYKNYCYQLYRIADQIESQVELLPGLQRRHLFVQDIAECPAGKIELCSATERYIQYLAAKSNPQTTGIYRGHIYTHYLGWLYGGQLIAKKLSLPKQHLVFDNSKECVDYVRNSVLRLVFDRDAIEAQKAFEVSIEIYKELYELHRAD